MAEIPVHGYWNIRGYGQPIRLLLAHADVEYKDHRYPCDEAGKSEWLADKFSLGMDFPNLPYYIDGDVKLSQTFAILKYLGRKHGLSGSTEEEVCRVDLIEAEAMDIRTKWSQTVYSTDFEKLKDDFIKNFVLKLKEVSNFLGDRLWFAGNKITYVDFLMYELLDIHSILDGGVLSGHNNLKSFVERFRSLDKIADYLKSDSCIIYPLTGPMASFGGK